VVTGVGIVVDGIFSGDKSTAWLWFGMELCFEVPKLF